MRLSQLFTKTARENPADEVSVNAQLLERGGFVYKNSAGIYTYLPLGWRVIQKIQQIIREEMNAIGGVEMLMQALIEKRYYEATGRAGVDVSFKTEDGKYIMSWTHEEIIGEIAQRYVSSYQDLPFAAYQIQTKFRNEPRAKSGILRGREFMMKDLYSFHATEADLFSYYEKVRGAYQKIFERCGLKAYYTLAAGGAFTVSNTHEFQVLAKAGEDLIYLCPKCGWAVNKEIADLPGRQAGLPAGKAGVTVCPKCGEELIEEKSIEVGNIFPLGTKYSEAFNLQFSNDRGEKQHVVMGSYGIGLGRVMGTVVEVHHDDRGIIWPESIAPFKVHLIALPGGETEAEKLYERLSGPTAGAAEAVGPLLYDDRRDKSAGEKFADADLIGCPVRIVVSKKTLEQNGAEVKKRAESESVVVHLTKIQEMLP